MNLKNSNTTNDLNNETNNDDKNFWTMQYDEGFEVNIGSYSFMAFFKYEKIKFPFQKSITETNCAETLVGWYHKIDNNQNM